jgi:hypothetical protein
MKLKVSSKRVATLIGAALPAGLLILSLNVHGTASGGAAHNNPEWQKSVSSSPARFRLSAGIERPAHGKPWLHDLVPSAITIASRI